MGDFPVWVQATHWANVLFIGLVMRAGVQILAAYPRLYWNDHCTPGTEWLTLTRRKIDTSEVWTALDQEEAPSAWVAQPGRNNLGLGRHWHFFGAVFWVLNGLLYVTLLITTDRWRRLVPTAWTIFPDAWHTLMLYATLRQPHGVAPGPFDPLQQLTYFTVVFILGPFLIATGAAQSPAIAARFPGYIRAFGGRQGARSLHFAGLVCFILFTIGHTALVFTTGFRKNLGDITLGQHETHAELAVGVAVTLVVAMFAFYALSSWYSRHAPRTTARALATFISPPIRALSVHARSRQQYSVADISPYLLVNGSPPTSDEYRLLGSEFQSWELEVRGLVTRPLSLSLADIKALPASGQVTMHHCIQGWSGIAAWRGVPLSEIVKLCEPLPAARYVVFSSYQFDAAGRPFYESLDIRLADHPQTLLAYEMNGRPLAIPYGAPLRLRVETELGFKMVKWLRTIQFVEDFRNLGEGQGGSREDIMHYEQSVSI